MTHAVFSVALVGAMTLGSVHQDAPKAEDPFDAVRFLVGSWTTGVPVMGLAPATMTFAWGEDGRMIRYRGTRPHREVGAVTEYEGVMTFDGVRDQLVFTAAYAWAVVESGFIEVHGPGSVTRHFDVKYAPGTMLPWSDGARAGAGGAVLRFRQAWTLQDSNTIHGEFFMERDGEWATPDFGPNAPRGPIVWHRARPDDPRWREDIAFRTAGSGLWLTSNGDYRTPGTEDAERYGMRFERGFGGVSMIGCLWGETTGRPPQVAWQFFGAWDPTEHVFFLHQSSADGTTGIGYENPGAGSSLQTFTTPDGRSWRARHLSKYVEPDTLITSSFDWVDGRWAPRRTYTWVRQARGRDTPC